MSESAKFDVKFLPSGRGAARCPSDPKYPNGIVLDVAGPAPSCRIDLPYPAAECGMFGIRCTQCGMTIAVTAAGRPDDPRAVIVACRAKAMAN